jgi:hypothetical protein
MQATFGWRLPWLYRLQVMGTVGVLAVVGVVMPAAGAAPAWFAVLWVAALCWNGYWFLLRIVHQLEVAAGVLRWRAPLRAGQIPIGEVVAIQPSRVAMMGHVVTTRRGTIWVTFATPGFAEFAAALQAAQPVMSVRVGRLARVNYPRRWLAGAGFYRDGG